MSGELAGSTVTPTHRVSRRLLKRQRIEEEGEEPSHPLEIDSSELLPERVVKFKLNGTIVQQSLSLTRPLAWTLRETFGLHGTKVACGQGNCGACTILVKYPDQEDAKPVNGCLFATGSLLVSEDSCPNHVFEVTTIEGVRDKDHENFAQAIVENNGTQCGFCTAGMIMKVAGSAKKGCSEVGDIEDLLNGNLCRCTGYRPILYAAKKTYLSQDNPCLEKEKGLTPPCVVRGNDRDYAKTYSNRSLSHPNVKQAVPLESAVLSPAGVSDAPMVLLAKPKMIPLESTVSSPAGASYAPMVLLAKPRIVPLESAVSSPAGASDAPMDMNLGAEVRAVSSKFKSMIMKQSNCLLSEVTRVEWHDTGPKDAVHLKKSEWRHFSSLAHFWNAVINSHPTTSFRIVAGNANHAWNRLDDAADSEAIMFLSLLSIKKLRCISLKDPKKIQIGSAVTLSTLNDEVLKDLCPAAASHLDTVANIQVRNFGTIGGNLAAARIYHKTSDIGLILSALNATIDIEYCIPSQSTSETKITVPIWTFLTTNVDEKCGLLLPPQCVWLITAINLDLSKKTLLSINPYFARVGRRIQNHPSLASVAATATNIIVTEAHCPKEFAKLWKCETSLSPSAKELYEQIKAEDMSTQYFSDGSTLRLIFHLAVQAKLLRSTTLLSKRIKEGQIGSQSFLVDVDASPVTEPIIKPNAYNLRTGSVVYTQDVKIPRNALEATFILSPVARLKFDSKDFGDVGKGIVDDMVGPGVAIFLTAEDASVVADAAKRRSKELGINTKENSLDFLKINGDDSTRKDFDRTQPFGEFIMASGEIGTTFCGQPIAMVLHPELTESRRVARHIQGLVDNWADSSAQQLTESFQKANAVLDLQTSVEKSAELNTRLPSAIVGRGDFLHLLDKEKLNTYLDVKQSVSIDEWIWDWKEYYKDADNYLVIESDTKAPSQSHLYLETQTAMCTEIQNNSFEVHASTQSASSIQDMAANLLGVPNSHVTVKNNIIGGGFGGKEPQSIPVAAAASFACAATGRPVRVMNDRQVDLKMIGKRHAMIGKYRVCIDRRDAKIVAMDLVLNGDAGASKSVSGPVLELAALVSDNAYGIRNFMCRATPYLTNKPTGTAFRSFGVVQTVQLTETAIQHAWDAVHQCGLSGISAPAFRRKHFSNQMPNDKIPCAPLRYNKYSGWTGYGQELRQYKNMGKIWNNIMEKYEEVEEQCNEFNENNRWRKRGVAVLPLRYGISFTFVAGNQGNARVAIFSTDGSVLVDHSGIEMGQGLIARAMVACAAELGVPMHFVRVGPFSTYSTPNAPGTGASTGTALSIPGVVEAAKKLRITLTKLVNAKVDTMLKQSNDCCYLCGAWRKDPTTRAKAVKILNEIGLRTERDNWETSYNGATNPWALYTFLGDSWRIPVPKDEKRDEAKRRIARQNEMWTKFVSGAFDQRKSLISLGYSTPNADGGNELSAQDIFYYFNYATAFSCVEVDCITGEISVLRTDIHYDCGLSHNPAIDVGQIEGGFVQGLGNMLTESVTYNESTGALQENSIMNYAIPDHRSIPQEFNVILTWEGGSKPISPEDDRTIQERAAKVQVDKISRSKTTGEPPLVLATCVLFAARRAVKAARMDHLGEDDWLCNFNAPLLPPNLLEALWGPGMTCLKSRHALEPDTTGRYSAGSSTSQQEGEH